MRVTEHVSWKTNSPTINNYQLISLCECDKLILDPLLTTPDVITKNTIPNEAKGKDIHTGYGQLSFNSQTFSS